MGSWVYTLRDYATTFDFLKSAKRIGLLPRFPECSKPGFPFSLPAIGFVSSLFYLLMIAIFSPVMARLVFNASLISSSG